MHTFERAAPACAVTESPLHSMFPSTSPMWMTVEPLVREQDVRALAQQIIPHARLAADGNGPRELPLILRLTEQSRRASDLEAGMARKRFAGSAWDGCLAESRSDLVQVLHGESLQNH